jgi:hypothetical protein
MMRGIVLRRPLLFILSTFGLLVLVNLPFAAVLFPLPKPPQSEDMPFFPFRASTDSRKLDVHMFQDPKACGGCHKDIFEEWENSVMANAWQDPIYRELLKRASEATRGALDNFCTGCHTPIGLTTGMATARGLEAKIAEEGVGCESCHNISAATGVGNGSFVLTPQKNGRPLKFGPRKDAESTFHDSTYSDVHTKSEICGACHNVTHPFNQLPIEQTYDEWRDSPYNAKGIHCQDCHMKSGPGVTGNPGRAAPMGKERDHVYSHSFSSANSTLLEYFGNKKESERARDMLRSAATIEFLESPLRIRPGEPVKVRLRVSNTGAGHKLPTGFPEGREVWVDFKVADSEGREVYRLGAIRDGHTEEGTKSFKATLGDSKGEVVDINVWEADRLLSDTRILPNGYADVEYAFTVDGRVRGPLLIQADLYYWAAPQHFVDELLGKGKMTVDIVRMGSVSEEIQLASTNSTERGR